MQSFSPDVLQEAATPILCMQTHYAAAVGRLSVAVQDILEEYKHYDSGVVRIEVLYICHTHSARHRDFVFIVTSSL